MKTSPPPLESDVIDLESSSQTDLERTFGCDSDSVVIDAHIADGIAEPHHPHSPSRDRELLQNQFPAED